MRPCGKCQDCRSFGTNGVSIPCSTVLEDLATMCCGSEHGGSHPCDEHRVGCRAAMAYHPGPAYTVDLATEDAGHLARGGPSLVSVG